MIEAWQAKCLHQNALLVHHIWHRHGSVCDQDVHLMQYRKLLHVLDQYRRDAIDIFAVVKADTLCLCHLFAKHHGARCCFSICTSIQSNSRKSILEQVPAMCMLCVN